MQRLQPQEPQRLHPQELEVLLLLLLVDVPATVPLWLQRQVQVQPVLLSDVPAPEPLDELFAQHGLQQEFWTKLGKIMPPKQPELQELHIVCASIKKMSRSISLHDILCRIPPGCYDLMPPFVAFACSTPCTIGSSGSRISCGFGSCSCFFMKITSQIACEVISFLFPDQLHDLLKPACDLVIILPFVWKLTV